MHYRDFIEKSIKELRLKTAAHDQLWHLNEADWDINQNTGEIVFSAPNGIVATCSVQIIGTFDTNDSTWLWAWDNPSIKPELTMHAMKLREYGKDHNIRELTTHTLTVTQEQSWAFTALACQLNLAQGAYRGPVGPTYIFVTFDEPTLTSTEQSTEQNSSDNTVINTDRVNEFTATIPPAVHSKLTGFITALYNCEKTAYQAYQNDDNDGGDPALAIAETAYTSLIHQWCVPSVEPQPISFGNDPNHNPDTEQLISACVTKDLCRVRTQHTDSTGFVSDYEYHLRCIDSEWLIENMFYIDGAEKYPSL